MKLLIGEELEDQALGRAIKANRKNDFVSKYEIIEKLKQLWRYFGKLLSKKNAIPLVL